MGYRPMEVMLLQSDVTMESQKRINPVIMDIHNWIMDIHNWIIDIHNWIMAIHN